MGDEMKRVLWCAALVMLLSSCIYGMNCTKVFRHVVPSVVSIHTPVKGGISACTGVMVDSYHIVTCAHCVAYKMESEPQVFIYPFGDSRNAHVIGLDRKHDLALLLISKRSGATRDGIFADSKLVQVGDPVMVIGNALGFLDWTATAGIVSGLDRADHGWIQSDATVNPGCSGGPVFDRYGHIIGLVEARIGPVYGIPGTQFFIPSNTVVGFLEMYTVHSSDSL